ncbi:MAG TPA: hypothetical protein TECP_00828 [Hyphomicrobiaceae bacterium MAG_BT-2024]
MLHAECVRRDVETSENLSEIQQFLVDHAWLHRHQQHLQMSHDPAVPLIT